MTDCKHEHLVHCPVCETVRCADCGRVWTFEQDRETTPALWPPKPHYVPPEFYRSWPEIGGPSDGTIPPPVDSIIITCGEGMTGTVVSERDNVTLTCGALT
jgi:hypothetical protein